ncbi:hypothetical protein [Deinococcus budaensis]|uniref:Uncharacterized protein n=1 Tax=Deinococcus budaensis TaxID=1665626 RepID=A0A7W8GBL0_9DEIO|nr:hypothetical protein [Deinococcus budaensis]MBB5232585.1 hypothetical protein [Deinococcus budaensis]
MPNEVNTALARLVRRAEQADSALLVDTFVDGGLLGDILMSPDHQIIYGRRGTGKTHALTYLADRISKSGDLPLLIDLRTIGSNGGIYSNNKLSQSERVSQLLVDVGNEIYHKLQDVLLNNDLLDSDQKFEKAVRLLEDLANGLEQIKVEGDIESEVSKEAVDSRSSQQGLTVSASQNPSATLNSSDTLASSSKSNEKHLSKGKARLRIHFGSISNPLEGILTLVDKRLYVLLDEWSVIPEDLQPYPSDMLKRTILSIRKVTLKIAAIEQRANFRESIGDSSYIGFELGADISADVNLDDFMVFDNDAEKSKEFFKDLFFRHVRADLPETASYATSDMLVSRGFTQINAFEELVRSAEGVPRDAINIAILAAQAANNDPISIPIVRGAARRWYQRDKEKSLEVNIDAERFLRYITSFRAG